ncbi:hypothetical protein ACU61S_09760 [Klebsiella aerogenes]
MKRLLSSAILLTVNMFSMSVYANPYNSCDGEQTIFDAYTAKGGKQVGVCYVYGNIRYVYGKDDNPEILINVPREKVEFSMSGNGDQSVTIPNGEYRYEIGEYLRGGPFIQVWKGSKFITKIKLNGTNFENNIEQYINN